MLATQNFSETYCIGSGGYGMVYKAKLNHFDSGSQSEIEGEFPKKFSTVAIKRIFGRADGQGGEGFFAEIKMLSKCKHPNIVSLLGFCDQGSEQILVYEHVSNGSLDDYLGNIDNMTIFSWVQRIKMCLDIANGLNYLHTTIEEKERIIHRDIKSANILLGKNWEAKIADFGLSRINPTNQQQASTIYTYNIAGTEMYLDPEYLKTGKLKKESDIYSFGVVLFEILCGRLAYDEIYNIDNDKGLPSIARRYFNKGMLKEIIDPRVMEETDSNNFTLNRGPDQNSLETFSKIAYQCLAETQAERPTMKVIINELEKALYFQENSKDNLKILLEDIKLATRNFSDECVIGEGGFGKVYKGEITQANGRTIIAAKRLDRKYGQGEAEFLKEIEILLEYKHECLIGLVGYCDEESEKIIVYEYASRRSLDRYLSSDYLTWIKRLEICIDIASGLEFLHGTSAVKQEVVIHKDIKCSNILLTEDWKAKITDFGLSLISTISQEIDYVFDSAVGTVGYCDPVYIEQGLLTKDSDTYSLGVVLFEILCGRLAVVHNTRHQTLVSLVREHFSEGKLEDIVLKDIKDQIVPESFMTYSMIAIQCVLGEKRPTVGEVVVQLKKALEFQEDHEIWEPKLPRDYKEIIQMSDSPETYYAISKKDLYNMMLSNGILLQNGKVWLSLGTKGERNEMISAKFSCKNRRSHTWRSIPGSRFQKVAEMLNISKLKTQIKVRTQFLSSGVTYGVYLVFKFCSPRKVSSTPMYVNLIYKIGNQSLSSYFATWRDDGWMMIELWRFVNHKEQSDFKVLLKSFTQYYCKSEGIYVQGIEFRAIHNVTNEEIKKLKEVQSDINVKHEEIKKLKEVQQLPQSNLKRDKIRFWTSKIKIKKDHLISKVNLKKDHVISEVSKLKDHLHSIKEVFYSSSARSSRLQEEIELLSAQVVRIKCKIDRQLLSPNTECACFLVFKLSNECSGLHGPVIVRDLLRWKSKDIGILYFRSPSPWNLHNATQVSRHREDGWMEVIVWKNNSTYELISGYIPINLKLIVYEGTMSGLVVRGLEFRPM